MRDGGAEEGQTDMYRACRPRQSLCGVSRQPQEQKPEIV